MLQLTNTCPIDNYIAMFSVHADILTDTILNSYGDKSSQLKNIISLINKQLFSNAKMCLYKLKIMDGKTISFWGK